MALQKRVSELPAVTTVAGTDLLIVSSNSQTKRTSVQQIGAYFAANGVAGPPGPQGPQGLSGSGNWAAITDKPSTFPPSAHQHAVGEVTGLQAALDGKAPLANPTFVGIVSGITKAMVGLGNVPNTDATARANHTGTQAVSTVSGLQAALDAKAPLANPSFTGLVDVLGDIGAGQAYFSSILVNGNHTITNASVSGSSRLVVDGQVVVLGNDARLTDARAPLAHNQAWSTITSTPTTLAGYGITDAVASSDSRLTNQRVPTDGSVTDAKIATAGLSASSINWVAIAPWQANTAYAKGDLVSFQGIAYRRSVASVSGATFNATNWQQITPSEFVGSQITSGTVAVARLPTVLEQQAAIGNSGTSTTLSLANGSVQTVTLSGNCTFTMPAASAGASLTLILTQSGTFTASFTGVLWAGGTAPTITATNGKVDVLVFVSNGTSWFGTASQNH